MVMIAEEDIVRYQFALLGAHCNLGTRGYCTAFQRYVLLSPDFRADGVVLLF